MAALQDLDSQLQWASTLSPSDIPTKLRCASCNKLAVFAWKMICCDQMICDPCHQGLATKCVVCEHSPLDENSSIESKSLRGTIKLFLKKEQVKRDKGTAKDETPVPAVVTPLAASEFETIPETIVEGPEVAATDISVAQEALNNKTEEPSEGAQELTENKAQNMEDAADDADNQSEADSDSSSVEIHLGDDDDHLQKPTYGPNAVTQQNGRKVEQPANTNVQDNMQMQSMSFDNSQMQNIAGFNGMNFDPATFQQMQQMMMQGGMSGMPGMNMINMPSMGDMNAMMQMFNNNLNSFGMNGMNGMNGMPGMPGMNMGIGMGFGNMGYGSGFDSQMNGSFGGSGYYPNGGYNQRQMHNAQFPNQYQHGFRRGNYQQRGHGRGYHRGNYYDQQTHYGQNAWATQGDQSNQNVHPEGLSSGMNQNGEHQQSNGTKDPKEAPTHNEEQGGSQDHVPDGHDTQQAGAIDGEATGDTPQNDQADSLGVPGPGSAAASQQGLEDHQGEMTMNQEVSDGVNDSARQDLEMHGLPNHIDPYQAQYGQPGRGRPLMRGRGGWRGRGSFMGHGPNSHAHIGAAVTLTPAAAPPENAPTGPKAMREGQQPPFGGRSGFRGAPSGLDSQSQVNGEHPPSNNEESLRGRSRSRSRERSAQNEGEKSSRYRDRSYSDREDSHDRRKDRKSRRSSHKYEDDLRSADGERHKGEAHRSRDTSVGSPRRHSSRRDKDKHRSSRPDRDRSRERRHKRRRSRSPDPVRELEDEPVDANGGAEVPTSEHSRRKRRHEYDDDDYDRDRERKQAKDRHRDRDRSKDRKRKRSSKDHYSDDDDAEHRSSHRSRKEKRSRHRERGEDDYYDDAYDDRRHSSKATRDDEDRDDYEARKASRRASRAHHNDVRAPSEAKPATSNDRTDDVGFSILGRSSNRSKADGPPTGPASMRPPPTGPRSQSKAAPTPPSAPSVDLRRRMSESSSKSRAETPSTPAAADPYQAEREKRNRERMAREQQRGKKQDDFAPPTGPRRRH